ncbi:CPX chromosomal region candidate gene 1 protein [Rhynchocyon petersi]
MTSPGKDGSYPADKDLKNSEEARNECDTDREPSFVDPNTVYQEELNQIDEETNTTLSKEEDFQEEKSKEESILIKIPIPRKLIFLMSGLGKITCESIIVRTLDNNNPLTDKSRFYSVKVVIKTKGSCQTTKNDKIPLQLSISWRIPFINNRDLGRMILRLLCGIYNRPAGEHKKVVWKKQKYVATVPQSNGERAIIPGKPLKTGYHRPCLARITSGKVPKSDDTKEKDDSHNFVRLAFFKRQNPIIFRRKVLENRVRVQPDIAIMIINGNRWKYLCPFCGSIFSTLAEFGQHICNLPQY